MSRQYDEYIEGTARNVLLSGKLSAEPVGGR